MLSKPIVGENITINHYIWTIPLTSEQWTQKTDASIAACVVQFLFLINIQVAAMMPPLVYDIPCWSLVFLAFTFFGTRKDYIWKSSRVLITAAI